MKRREKGKKTQKDPCTGSELEIMVTVSRTRVVG
jgi:hypothetical protein